LNEITQCFGEGDEKQELLMTAEEKEKEDEEKEKKKEREEDGEGVAGLGELRDEEKETEEEEEACGKRKGYEDMKLSRTKREDDTNNSTTRKCTLVVPLLNLFVLPKPGCLFFFSVPQN
jgi:hypothetical protein